MEAKNIYKRFTVKRVVMGRGHDCGGLICDIYFDKKKVGGYHDDGWGGEPEIRIDDAKAEKTINDLMKTGVIAKDMYENLGWSFVDSPDDISEFNQLDNIISLLANKVEEEKDHKKGVLYATGNGRASSYQIVSWGNVQLPTAIKRYGVKAMNDVVTKKVNQLETDGYTVLNKEMLKSLKLID